jgi:hypothetical protein
MKLLIFIALLIAVAFAQSPAKPVWPSSFSATVVVSNDRDHRPRFFRWFYDQAANKDRLDGVVEWKGEEYFAEVIFDHRTQTQTNVFYDQDTVTCFEHAINRTLPKPTFNDFDYVGLSLINYAPNLVWNDRLKGRPIFLTYYEAQQGRVPTKFVVHDVQRFFVEEWNFFEFDANKRQDPTLFELPPAIKSICSKVNF